MQVEKPIFIVGVGRSGSTIFHRMFAEHPQVAWLPYIADQFPTRLALLRAVLTMVDQPLIGELVNRKVAPGEGYRFWETYCKGFSEPFRDLTAHDVTNRHKTVIPHLLAQLLTAQRRRLLMKITGWPRIGFLQGIFPDAKFIHIKRDGRAVINSLLNVRFWSGWRGPQGWRCGALTPAQLAVWEQFDRSFVALAGLELQILLEATEKARQQIAPDNFLELTYETLCADPIGAFQTVTAFAELPWSSRFEERLKRYRLSNTNYKWQQELTNEQQKILDYFVDEPRVPPISKPPMSKLPMGKTGMGKSAMGKITVDKLPVGKE